MTRRRRENAIKEADLMVCIPSGGSNWRFKMYSDDKIIGCHDEFAVKHSTETHKEKKNQFVQIMLQPEPCKNTTR